MKKKKIINFGFLFFLVIIVLLTFFSNTISNYTLAKVVVSYPIESSLIKQVNAKGFVEPVETQEIYFDGGVSTKVLEVHFREGDLVKKGDIIIELEESKDKTSLEIERAKLEKMEYLYNEAVKAKSDGINTRPLEQSVDAHKRKLDQVQEQYSQILNLYNEGAATANTLNEARYSLDEINELYNNSLENLDIARQNEEKSINEQKYNIDIQVLVIEQLEKIYEYNCLVRAETDGIIQKINVDKGTQIGAGSLLFSIINTNAGFEFVSEIDTDKADFISVGDNAQIRIKSWGNNGIISGTVSGKSESAKNKGVDKEVSVFIENYIVKGDDEEESRMLTGNEGGEVYIEKGTKFFEMVVPNSSLIPGMTDELKYIWVLEEKQGFLGSEYHVKKAEVMVLEEDNYHSAIQGSILKDDRIIIQSDKILFEDSKVLIEKTD